ncbi:MAG: hypothetical protein S4CHLAM37_16290 [Chlamydiia bacterium]|nr:hypothetical protein [Chlamydiia bacterium]
MKKFWGILIAVIIVIFAVGFFGWNYVPGMIAKRVSKMAKVKVTIGHISLLPKKIGVYDFVMNNPKGSSIPRALKVKKTIAKAPISNYFKDDVVIDEITLSNVYLGLEFEKAFDTKSNWTTIINNINSSSKSDPDSSEDNSKTTVLIKRLVITNLNVDMVFRQGNQKVKRLKPIPRMEFQNLSSEGGIPSNQLTSLIINEMMKDVLHKKLQNLFKEALQPGGSGSSPFGGLKSLFGKTPE